MVKSHRVPTWEEKEVRSNFARASRAGKRVAKTEPRASSAVYLPKGHALRIELTNGIAMSVPGLLSSVFAGPEWLAELSRIGGRKFSAARAAAARRNGRKGGRPSRADRSG